MPYPSKPSLGTSYTAVEQSIGDGSFPGQELDVDLVALRDGVGELVDFVRLFTRSDGKLANGIVTTEALAPSVLIGFAPPAPWVTGTDYTTSSTVFEGYGFYLCLVAHTAGADFNSDLSAGRWQLLADLTPPAGVLLAANNLNDVGDAAAARSNLGLGTMATANSGTGSSQYRTNTQNDARFVHASDVGTSVQAYDAALDDISGLTPTDGNIIVGDGSNWVAESGSTARATLGAQAADAALTSLAGLSLAAGDVIYATGADTLARLAKGTAGQVLTMNSGATAPEWVATQMVAAVSYNGTSGTVISSHNVASVTKNGTGDYTVNFSGNLPDTDYFVVAIAKTDSPTATRQASLGSKAVGSVSLTVSQPASGLRDTDLLDVVVFR